MSLGKKPCVWRATRAPRENRNGPQETALPLSAGYVAQAHRQALDPVSWAKLGRGRVRRAVEVWSQGVGWFLFSLRIFSFLTHLEECVSELTPRLQCRIEQCRLDGTARHAV